VTILMCGHWRTFENGVWSQWQEEKLNWPAPGIADVGRTALLGKVVDKWIVGYVESNPNSYRPIDCKEVESLSTPALKKYFEAKLHLVTDHIEYEAKNSPSHFHAVYKSFRLEICEGVLTS
jgi:hypothetical protein